MPPSVPSSVRYTSDLQSLQSNMPIYIRTLHLITPNRKPYFYHSKIVPATPSKTLPSPPHLICSSRQRFAYASILKLASCKSHSFGSLTFPRGKHRRHPTLHFIILKVITVVEIGDRVPSGQSLCHRQRSRQREACGETQEDEHEQLGGLELR
jgi:hypothetical protein